MIDLDQEPQYRPRIKLGTRQPRRNVRLRWKQYFAEFCRLHGDPVLFDAQLLFPDGWRYSADNYGGPEWPSPTEPAQWHRLLRAYWAIRRKELVKRYNLLREQLEGLRRLQAAHSAAVHWSFEYDSYDDDDRRVVRTTREPVDFDYLERELNDVQRNLQEADSILNDRSSTGADRGEATT